MGAALWQSSDDHSPELDSVSDARARRLAWLTWAVLFAAACGWLFSSETGKPVNNAYAQGAQRWLEKQTLYEGGSGFIYLPQSAVLYAPFYSLPSVAEQSLWRFINVGLFALGIARLSRLAGRGHGVELFPMVTWLVIPKTWTCACNGQATLAMTGLSMLALAEIHDRRWYRSAAMLVAALAFKPLVVVMMLLTFAIHRPLRIPLTLGLGLFFVAPFALRDADYVLNQYRAMLPMFGESAAMGLEPVWAQLFSLCSLAGIQVSAPLQTWLRLAAAVATLALCRHVVRRAQGESSARLQTCRTPDWLVLFSLATAYLLLFNPRTENNSYVMLSPVLGLLCARAYHIERRMTRAMLLGAAAIFIVAGHELCGWLTPNAGFIWICPLACLLFTIDCVIGVTFEPHLPASAEPELIPASDQLVFPARGKVAPRSTDLADAA